jgi:hypothetical protein
VPDLAESFERLGCPAAKSPFNAAIPSQRVPGINLIGDPTLADAILDRIIHNTHRLQLSGDSFPSLGLSGTAGPGFSYFATALSTPGSVL